MVIMNILLGERDGAHAKRLACARRWSAKQRDVLMQFLIESASMAVIGGAIGVMCGILAGKLITIVIGFPTSAPLWAIFSWAFPGRDGRHSSSAFIPQARQPSWTQSWHSESGALSATKVTSSLCELRTANYELFLDKPVNP